ncbi:von Willebrand factor type A domain protein [Stieleria bergensis]|uniref:von Willebrand factor type A domain protein n=1 Tax=Stieleria bergensis TaxID=2528025 RepID=A0A517STD0_9BACT|nr:von Willebrand factor type A domain protein [Planctomycetes bacterium SV_7m_r]
MNRQSGPPPLYREGPPLVERTSREREAYWYWIGLAISALALLIIFTAILVGKSRGLLGNGRGREGEGAGVHSGNTQSDRGDRLRSTSRTKPSKPSRLIEFDTNPVPLCEGVGNPLRVSEEMGSVVYVIDKSGSMSLSRFQSVLKALKDSIDALDSQQMFAVLMFDTSAYEITQPSLVSASDSVKQRTKRSLDRVTPGGGTSPLGAVKIALDLSPDCVVILTDGEFDSRETEQITSYNRSRPKLTRIHTIGLSEDMQTLETLARDNGHGVFTTAKIVTGN